MAILQAEGAGREPAICPTKCEHENLLVNLWARMQYCRAGAIFPLVSLRPLLKAASREQNWPELRSIYEFRNGN